MFTEKLIARQGIESDVGILYKLTYTFFVRTEETRGILHTEKSVL
jgi:hypothetical protein